MPHYVERCFTVEEAARISGIKRTTLDVMLHRLGASCPISAKRGSRRWFSRRDIVVLSLVIALENAGTSIAAAFAVASTAVAEPPDDDAILLLDAETKDARVIGDADVPRLLLEQSKILIPIGAMSARIARICGELYQHAA